MNEKEIDFHDHELDHVFYFLLSAKTCGYHYLIKCDFDAVSLVCKKWRCNLMKMVTTSRNANFDRVFHRILRGYNFQYYGLYGNRFFEQQIQRYACKHTENLLPVDVCPHCKRLRLVFENRWCGVNDVRFGLRQSGCGRWQCDYRVDPIDHKCWCCGMYENVQERDEIRELHRIMDERVEKAAYFIWKTTGCDDEKRNYFEARKLILYPPEIYTNRKLL